MMRRVLILVLMLCSMALDAFALSYLGSNGQRGHRDDFMAVLPFVWDCRLDEWGRRITGQLDQVMKDSVPEYGGLSTYQYLKQRFGIRCNIGEHRIFFHWGYQSRPWCDALLEHLPDSVALVPEKLLAFQEALRVEQARRNRITNEVTERILGFGSGGRSARYANAFVAILYDVHLLGDYESSSTVGLAEVPAIVREISTNLNNIDAVRAKPLVKELAAIARGTGNQASRAKSVLAYLRFHLPQFILSADDGTVNMRSHFEAHGFKFRPGLMESTTAGVPGTASPIPNPQSIQVGVTGTGKYHKPECANLRKAKNPEYMSLEVAESKGKVPAKCCFK